MSITDKLSLVENSYNEIVEKLNNGNIKDNRAIQELMKKKSEIEDIVFEYKKLKEGNKFNLLKKAPLEEDKNFYENDK